MAFDFGPAGRRRLEQIMRSGTPDQRRLAQAALATTDRHQVEEQVRKAHSAATLEARLRVVPAGSTLPPELRESIAATRYCRVGPCVVTLVDERRAVIAGPLIKDDNVESALLMPNAKGIWQQDIHSRFVAKPPFRPDVSRVPVELRTVERRQLFIDGKPVGDALE
jgi:predicted naringenin-chalcone synthase